jgi:hypothetical protein
MLKRFLLAVAATMLAGAAVAQPDFFHRPSPFAGRTILTLELFDEVRTELKTTPDANKKVDGMLEGLQSEIMDAFQGANGDFGAAQEAVEKINAKYDDQCLAALTPDQDARLKQLFIQFNGASAVTQPLISKDLAITDDQKAQIKKLQADQRQKMMDAAQGGGPPDPATMQKMRDDMNASIDKVLTDDQKSKLKDLQGPAFVFKKVESGG